MKKEKCYKVEIRGGTIPFKEWLKTDKGRLFSEWFWQEFRKMQEQKKAEPKT